MSPAMRFAVAVLVGGVLIALRYWSAIDWIDWPVHLAFLALVAFAVGFAAGSWGWLAASLAFVIGHALWIGVELRPGPPWSGADVWGWTQWGIVLWTMAPTAVGAAIFGALGAWAARVAARHAKEPRTSSVV